ncbi:hypothetical protein J2T57_003826 [Natronocella acetinitrilica]|uniref:Glycosyl hydrolase n=1 Tax=Natronocella acetinitrilica TaxID=414046 RepID=A0AAE3KCA4_9GAMM|nr:hypothetical protein [Natronocella acetinitrilica]MCP1676655.1 hypothetical protein [Natronocella acetinitrilica]
MSGINVRALAIAIGTCAGAIAVPLAAAVAPERGVDSYEGSAADTFAALGALTVKGRLMRSSELGHEAYQPTLAGDPMGSIGQTWLELLRDARDRHVDNGDLRDAASPEEPAAMRIHADAAYIYHMHHSAGRFEAHGLFDELTHEPSPFLSQIGQQLLRERYTDGRFHQPGQTDNAPDASAMAHGLDAFHATAYAWVRWHKPGGASDMGQLDEATMEAWMGHDRGELLGVARAVATTLDEHWDEDAGVYRFDDGGTTWAIDDLGALVRGHKGLYEILHIFGEESDRQVAAQLFDRAAAMSDALLGEDGPATPWGLPAEVRFEEGAAVAASDRIDVAAQWRLVHQVTGGFSILREREGTTAFLDERSPNLTSTIGGGIDDLLSGALDHQLVDGIVVAELDATDGSVRDDRATTQAVTAFIRGVGNGYRTGTAFDRPGSWEDDEKLAERSERLYDRFLNHGRLLTDELLQ